MWSRFVMSQVKHNSYFLCGVVLGLWVSLAVIPLDEQAGCVGEAAAAGAAGVAADEFEPAREERPLGPAGQSAGRSVQRPRYYTTELGMRGSLLSGVLSSEDALKSQVAALNQTMGRLQPALKFFITASAMSAVPGLANVVGFTDTREMLKPFHALKYLADNYLEEYDFFFLVSDGAFVNARRLTELVSKLSVSQDIYMGTVAEDDSHYCSLESGFIISNSVLRAVHSELDWCVRNSYSAHHHENIGRCVLHAAHLSCSHSHQGERYESVRVSEDVDSESESEALSVQLQASLARAVTAHPAHPARMHRLHAYVARVQLEHARAAVKQLRGELWSVSARHPAAARNGTWPGGLRAEPGLAPPPPPTRFDHLRWTLFNASHGFMSDEHRAVSPHAPATHAAIQLVVESVRAWGRRRWPWAEQVELLEGGWQWDPPRALRYRMQLRLTATAPQRTQVVRLVEAVRPLGCGRLVPVRYVTESGRVSVLVPLPTLAAAAAASMLQRYVQLHALRDANTHLYIVAFPVPDTNTTSLLAPLRAALASLPAAQRATAELIEASSPVEASTLGEVQLYERLGRKAVRAVAAKLATDALVLLIVPDLEFNQDFLNRVRMNTIPGVSWFVPLPFRRHALHAHPRRPHGNTNTGRFNERDADIVAFYRSDLDAAEAEWRGDAEASVSSVLAASAAALRVLRAPEPGAVLPPRPPPCQHAQQGQHAQHGQHAQQGQHAQHGQHATCRRNLQLDTLDLGARNALAQLLLETQHDQEQLAT